MEPQRNSAQGAYVLLTAAHNEEKNISKTLASIAQQTILPVLWVIVSDNSTDGTDALVQEFAAQHPFVRLARVSRPHGHSFAAKILALREGYKHLGETAYQFIGNLDADISLDPSYFQELLERMHATPSLGIASGSVYEEMNDQFQPRPHNRTFSVPHAAQLVRRECYEQIGGYAILEFGGEDTHATISARMKGWLAESFADLKIYHQRHSGQISGRLRCAFRAGKMDYDLGYDFLFETFKSFRRMLEQPFLLGGTARWLGFLSPYLRGADRAVGPEFAAFVRTEQRKRLWSPFSVHKNHTSNSNGGLL
jgi:poly-beta-1,6-N-acetyl-D-glucosamine synthase